MAWRDDQSRQHCLRQTQQQAAAAAELTTMVWAARSRLQRAVMISGTLARSGRFCGLTSQLLLLRCDTVCC